MLIEPLSPDDLDRVHGQAMRILSEVGTEVHDDAMCARLRGAGQHVDGTRVRWDPEFVLGQLALAPGSVALTGRNPDRAVEIGGAAWRTRRPAAPRSHTTASGAAATARSPTTSSW